MGKTIESEILRSDNETKRLEVITDLNKKKLISELNSGMGDEIKNTTIKKESFNLKRFFKKYFTWH